MIGNRLKIFRNNKDLTQEDMAKILGVSRGHYGMWEIDKEIIPLKKLYLLCNYFNISMNFIIEKNTSYKESINNELNLLDIGNRLKQIRKENNMSQKELANFLGTTQSTISAYEVGKTLILTDFAVKTANTFNISLDYLCCRTDNEKRK